MISFSSAKNFCIVNSSLCLIGFLQYRFVTYHESMVFLGINLIPLYVFFIFVARNYVLLHMIEYGTRSKSYISQIMIPNEEYKYEFHVNLFNATAIETVTHLFIKTHLTQLQFSRGIYYEIAYFIPFSFLFEIVFDFFHYGAHIILHDKSVYKYLHKKHHKFTHPIAITTFYQDPLDLILTNSIPTVLALYMVPGISYFQFHIMTVYKIFIEIGGHSGKLSYPTTSFPQFMWLPKWLHIDLSSEDHDIHHSLNHCNYAKRFSLWDKVFGTYVSVYKRV